MRARFKMAKDKDKADLFIGMALFLRDASKTEFIRDMDNSHKPSIQAWYLKLRTN